MERYVQLRMSFLSPRQLEQRRAARAAWQAKYGGSELHRAWASAGYWAAGEKYGFETVNRLAFGQNLSRAQYKQIKNGGQAA